MEWNQKISRLFTWKANVAVLDGASFGEYGEGHLRMSYATSMETIEKAIVRIEKALKLL